MYPNLHTNKKQGKLYVQNPTANKDVVKVQLYPNPTANKEVGKGLLYP